MADETYTETVKKLTKKTNEGEIDWEAYDPSDEVNKGEGRDGYKTKFMGKELRIYKQALERPMTSIDRMLAPQEVLPTLDSPSGTRTITKTVLKLKDPQTNGEWTFPEMSILDDLHSSAEQASAGVQKWMSDVLDEE